ncbi:hypothetical protein NQ315_004302 [Exocentrus adspersus]|uniref:Palmitoyltransferase n=1 Tax=Exocentrus adspersus TaxID=1586481 RepID=A0AAV8W772_9CUCU|nr:hypothetical protein NQ315_004302 [Exocentrus adspersus]
MIIRQDIWPKCVKDAFVTGFVLVIIPLIYYFELFIVLPRYYRQWSFTYDFHFMTGTFILFNLCANYVAIVMCDTSIKGRILRSGELLPNWRFCSACETVAPPRSWHCKICKTCILKRDHHCMFTSCCIGHENQRYFLVFVFYMFVATMYASYYNIHFVRDYLTFGSWTSIFKVIFPLAMLFMEWTESQLYVFFVIIVLAGGAFTGGLLWFHSDLMLKGLVSHDKDKKSKFDNGIRANIEVVLGEKWYLVWLWPWIESKLPCDGINWNEYMSDKME